jgi:hypothetical protein
MKKLFTLCFVLIGLLSLPMTAMACDQSTFTVNSVTDLGGGYYEFNVTFCAGAGQNATRYGADQNTYTWAIVLDNGAVVTSHPAFLTSPNTGAVYFGDTISYMGSHYLVYDYYSGANAWWTCIDGGCGPVASICIDVTFTTFGMPNLIIGGGAESAGIVVSGYGCNDEPDMQHNLLSVEANAGPDVNICNGTSATLQGEASDGIGPYTYLWSDGATTATTTVSPAANTTYTLTVTDANGSVATDAVNVNVNANPTANAGPDKEKFIGYGATCVTLTGSASGGTAPYTYLWSNGSTLSSPSVCPASSTTYTMTVTDSKGCTSTDAATVTVENIVCGTGKVYVCHYGSTKCYKTSLVASHLTHGDYLGTCDVVRLASDIIEDEAVIEIYPNPAQGTAELTFHLEEADYTTIRVFNMAGQLVQVVMENRMLEEGDWLESMDVRGWQSGIYQVVMSTSNGDLHTTRLMVTE